MYLNDLVLSQNSLFQCYHFVQEYNDIIKIMKTGAIALKDDDKSDDEEDEMSQKE